MGLFLRMAVLYPLFLYLASLGIVVFNPDTGDVTFNIQHLELVITGLVGYLGTFGFSRLAKAKGGSV